MPPPGERLADEEGEPPRGRLADEEGEPPRGRLADEVVDEEGERLADEVVDELESLLTDWALDVVNPLARARRVTPYHVALQVPGLCHTHLPDARVVDGCAFCARRGAR